MSKKPVIPRYIPKKVVKEEPGKDEPKDWEKDLAEVNIDGKI